MANYSKISLSSFSLFAFFCASCGKPTPQTQGNSSVKVIYGEDDRRASAEWTETEKMWAKTTAALIDASKITRINDEISIIEKVDTFGKSMPMCEGEKFEELVDPAFCSGFLAGDSSTLVTAGHCIQTHIDCLRTRFVFNMASPQTTRHHTLIVKNSDIYGCAQVTNSTLIDDEKNDRLKGKDFSIVKLDRANQETMPLPVQPDNAYAAGTALTMIGHPAGLPTIVTTGKIIENTSSGTTFLADVDAYGGNSGSMVLDTARGQISGILVNGATDYEFNETNQCYTSKRCEFVTGGEDCAGEGITKSSLFRDALGSQPKIAVVEKTLTTFSDDFTVSQDSEYIIRFDVPEKAIYFVGLNSVHSTQYLYEGSDLSVARQVGSFKGSSLQQIAKGPHALSFMNAGDREFIARMGMKKAIASDIKAEVLKLVDGKLTLDIMTEKFKPTYLSLEIPEGGSREYVLRTTGATDTMLKLFAVQADGGLSFVAENDDSNGDLNAKLANTLKVGKYIIEVATYSGDAASFQFVVE
jgi:V8-like Glu-specific endopeptidase